LHAFKTEARGADGRVQPLYLHTSPEFACKKLLAAGETRIYALGPVFRNRERGPLHAPEFTLLEWYRAREPYESVMGDAVALVRRAAEAAGTGALSFRGARLNPAAAPERLSVADAFARYAEIDLLATLTPDGMGKAAALAQEAQRIGIRVAGDDNWSDIFSRVLAQRVEPKLGREHLTLLCDYPLPEAALAKPLPRDPRLAARFELYALGVELANGFGELTDPELQRQRFTASMNEKARIYGEAYPLDEDFLAALALMPDASGIALGFDRLVMLATGAAHIDQVIWTPFP
jgi:lysyl-tRNA synthetase class 2